MGKKHIGVRSKMPFETNEAAMPSLSEFFEQAKRHLVETVESYKITIGKSFVDQKLLVPEEYQDLIWFIFPSEVTQELMQLKKGSGTTFAALEALAN